MILSDSKKYWNLIAYKFCRLQECHDFISCIKSWAFDKKLVKEKVLQPFRCHFFYLKLYFSYIKNIERCWLDIIKKQKNKERRQKKCLWKFFLNLIWWYQIPLIIIGGYTTHVTLDLISVTNYYVKASTFDH